MPSQSQGDALSRGTFWRDDASLPEVVPHSQLPEVVPDQPALECAYGPGNGGAAAAATGGGTGGGTTGGGGGPSPHPTTIYSGTPKSASDHQSYWAHQRFLQQQQDQPTESQEKKTEGSPVGWRRRKKWWIIGGGVALLVVIIVLATVLGVMLGRRGDSSDPDENSRGSSESPDGQDPDEQDPDGPPALGILDGSSMAAVNWTDENQKLNYGVFYQDTYANIIFSYYLEEDEAWSAVNVSDNIRDSSSQTTSISVPALLGTPLSSVAIGFDAFASAAGVARFQVNVYYFTPERKLVEIVTSDPAMRFWRPGVLNDQDITVVEGSGLASYWAPFWELGYHLSVFCQMERDPENLRRVARLNGQWELAERVGAAPEGGVHIAVAPVVEDRDVGPEDVDPLISMRLYTNIDGFLRETAPFPSETEWVQHSFSIREGLNASASISAVSFGQDEWRQWMVASLIPSKDIELMHFGPVEGSDLPNWSGGLAVLRGSRSNDYDSFVMGMNRKAFVLSGGAIYEFNMERPDPMRWQYVSVVETLP